MHVGVACPPQYDIELSREAGNPLFLLLTRQAKGRTVCARKPLPQQVLASGTGSAGTAKSPREGMND